MKAERQSTLHEFKTPANCVDDAFIEQLLTRTAITCASNYMKIIKGNENYELQHHGLVTGPVPNGRTKKQLINTKLHDFLRRNRIRLFPPNTFLGWVTSPREIILARRRKLHPSKNHRAANHSKRKEKGISVTNGPGDYWTTRTHFYLVTGKVIAKGSDHEPVLARNTIRVLGLLKTRRWLLLHFYRLNKETIRSLCERYSCPERKLFCFLLGVI